MCAVFVVFVCVLGTGTTATGGHDGPTASREMTATAVMTAALVFGKFPRKWASLVEEGTITRTRHAGRAACECLAQHSALGARRRNKQKKTPALFVHAYSVW